MKLNVLRYMANENCDFPFAKSMTAHSSLTSLFMYISQVHGVVVWEVNVVLEAARVERYGVLILKVGPPCIPTVTKQNDQTTSRAASGCVTGTKSYMTGSWVPGTSVSQ